MSLTHDAVVAKPLLPDRAHRSLLRKLRFNAPVYAFAVAWFGVVLVNARTHVLPMAFTWASLLVLLVAGGVYVVLCARRFARENAAAIALLDTGELVAAADRFAALHRAFRNSEPLGATAAFNLATTELRLGAMARAIELLEEIQRDRPKGADGGIHRLASAHLAYVHALAGDLGAARAWLAEARRRAAIDTEGVTLAGVLATTEGALELRTAGPAAGARVLREHWSEIDTHATPEFARVARVLRAFAFEGEGAPRAEVERELTLARDAAPGSLAYLGTAWPELRAFLEREGLANSVR